MKYITYDQLPLMLNAEDVQSVMNISRAGAYQLMHRADFPVIMIGEHGVRGTWMLRHGRTCGSKSGEGFQTILKNPTFLWNESGPAKRR